MSQELTVKKEKGLKSLLSNDEIRDRIQSVLPKYLTSERLIQVALAAAIKTPKLNDCTKESVLKCIIDLASIGLEPDGRKAHLIPYEDKRNNITICTAIPDYKGIIEVAKKHGDVKSWNAYAVCEAERDSGNFEWVNGEIKHKIDWLNPRGKELAYYSVVEYHDGSREYEIMTIEEITRIRDRSQGYKSAAKYGNTHPWITDFGEMAKKTVIKRHSKKISISPEVSKAVEMDNEVESTGFNSVSIRDVTPNDNEEADEVRIVPKEEDIKSIEAEVVEDSTPQEKLFDLCFEAGFTNQQVISALESFKLIKEGEAKEIKDVNDNAATKAVNNWEKFKAKVK